MISLLLDHCFFPPDKIHELSFKLLPHPVYLSNLASYFHLFLNVKKCLIDVMNGYFEKLVYSSNKLLYKNDIKAFEHCAKYA